MGFSGVVRVASRGSHGDKVSLCTAAGNLGGHRGCKGEQKGIVCGPWAEWEQVRVLSSCFTWEMDVPPWLCTWEAPSFALRGMVGRRNRRPCCLREEHHYSFATNYFSVIFSLREFFAKPLAEQLIHSFPASMLFSLLKRDQETV